jgi:murein DD-endopeptidase
VTTSLWPAVLAMLWLSPSAAVADTIETYGLGLPLACTIGETCWVANYVDVDVSGEARDFRCRKRTYDTHDGMDFAIRDLGVMAQGVPVIASAPGVVKNVRDEMEDIGITDEASKVRIVGRECGNGVVIDHEGGWQTQYCHMRKGSIRVKAGDRMEAGNPIGMVGLSGKTEFPHVHLTVRHNGEAVDPFTGQPMKAGCGLSGKPLWRVDKPVPYEEVALYNAGFATGKPNMDMIRSGKREDGPLPATAPALILWVDIFGVETGDRIRLRVTGPGGKLVVDHEDRVEQTQARRFSFAGTRQRGKVWPAGEYRGEVSLMRKVDGQDMKRSMTRAVTIR